MIYNYGRIQLQYLTYGLGLFAASVKCVLNWKTGPKSAQYLVTSLLGVELPLLIVFLTVINITFLYLLFKTEKKWDLKLSKKQKIWKMRPKADSGIWLATLFPLTLVISSLSKFETCTSIYLITATLALGYLVSSLIFLHKGIQEDGPNAESCFLFQLPLCAVMSVFLHCTIPFNIWFAFPYCVFAQTLFVNVVVKLTTHCPFSFTIGEVLAVSQMIVTLMAASLLSFFQQLFHSLCNEGNCHYVAETTQFLQVLAIGSGVIVATLSSVPFFKKALPFYSLCVVFGMIVVYPAWFFVLGMEPFTWLLFFCFRHTARQLLIAHWIGCVLVALSVVMWRNYHGLQATTTVRKYFHAIAVLIFFPGLFWDLEMLFLASGVTLFIFFVLEIFRLLEMPPFGLGLNPVLRIFLDEKDAGNLILTHVYLLVGCSLPLWILPSSLGFSLATLSGVLALGFGDTAASVGGTLWGVHKLPDSKKSVEGTVCAIFVQLIVTILICFYAEFELNAVEVMHICVATVVCCGLEAFTNQVDNLVLPLFLYLMFVVL